MSTIKPYIHPKNFYKPFVKNGPGHLSIPRLGRVSGAPDFADNIGSDTHLSGC